MKRKLILSIFAALLAVAMLLPLASCGLIEKAEEGGTTEISTENAIPTESPTEAQTDPVPTPSAEITNVTTEPQPPVVTTDPIRGAWIPHTEAMLALEAEWQTSNEAWKFAICECVFHEIYESCEARKGEQYRIWLTVYQEDYDEEWIGNFLKNLGFPEEDTYYISEPKDIIFPTEQETVFCKVSFVDMYVYPERLKDLASGLMNSLSESFQEILIENGAFLICSICSTKI